MVPLVLNQPDSVIQCKWFPLSLQRGRLQSTTGKRSRSNWIHLLHWGYCLLKCSTATRWIITCLPTISSSTLRPLSPILIQHVSASSAVFSTFATGCASRRLQLNAQKTELMWYGSAANIRKISAKNLSLSVDNDVVTPVAVMVSDLGVYLDAELTMKHRINRVTSNCFFQLRRLRQMRRVAGPDVTTRLMSALVLSRLEYCNAALAGLPQTTLRPHKRVQNAADRLVTNTGSRDHITPAMKELHWLPVNQRIKYITVPNDASHSHNSRVRITCMTSCRWQLSVPRELDFVRPMASHTGSQESERSLANVLSVIPDLLRGTRYLSTCKQPLTLTLSSVYLKLTYSLLLINYLLPLLSPLHEWQCNVCWTIV